MNQTSKRLFTCIIAFALCFHFVWIVEYCLPKAGSNSRIQSISRLYVYPIFHQNWGLFVPAPNVERKLFVRYKTNDRFTDWEDLLSKEIIRHKQNRLLGNESRVLLISNSLIYELNSLDKQRSGVYFSVQSNKEFKVLKFEIDRYLQSEYKLNETVDYELLLVSCGKDDTKVYYMKSLTIN